MKKLKVIMQNRNDDCGICCTIMILRYYGHYIKQSEVEQNELFKDTDGINNMLDIKRCVQYYGLIVKAFKVKDNDMFNTLKEPAILFWDYNHFVVFEKKRKGKYYIIDPNKGRECISSEEFEKHFTGMTLIFEKGKEFHKKRMNVIKEIHAIRRSRIWNVKIPIKYVAGLMISQLLIYLIPLLIRSLISGYSVNNEVSLRYGLSLLITIVLYVICSIFTSNWYVSYIKKLKQESNHKIVEKVLQTPYSRLRKLQAGDILSRIGNNNAICEIITSEIPKAIISILFSIIATIYLLRINSLFTCILLIICLLISLSNFLLISKTTEYIQVEVSHFAGQHSALLEGMSSLYFIKANNIAERFINKWKRNYNTYLECFGTRQKIVSYFSVLQNFTSIVSQLLFLTMSFVLAILYPAKLADISLFLTMSTLIYTPITQISFSVVGIMQEVPNFNRIIDLIKDSQKREKKESFTFNKELSVKNVSFRYPGTLDNTLHDISLNIKRGESVAILGESGAGKTTFINLLLGIESDFMGSIDYDGKNVKDLDMNDSICCITQDNVLYNGNLVEYLALFIDDYDDDKVMYGIEKLRLENLFKEHLVNGVFKIDGNGTNLSGGQRQRLALLRMFLKRYDMLILDEPTSHLDEVTAQIVIEEICARDATKIIITHDTRLLDKADSIYEMKEHKLLKIK